MGIKNFILVGMSMGARNSTLFTTKYPEMVKKLVLVDWAPAIESKGVAKIIEALKYEGNSFEDAVNDIHALNPRRSKEQIRNRLTYSMYQKPSGKWGWRVPGKLFEKRFNDEFTSGYSDHLWEQVAKIAPKTLLIRGKESDVLAVETAQKMEKVCSNIHFVEVAKAGHSVAGDNPAAFYDVVMDFLST
jgi:pimeloyl-ACP methyl ester carboxylesterase